LVCTDYQGRYRLESTEIVPGYRLAISAGGHYRLAHLLPGTYAVTCINPASVSVSMSPHDGGVITVTDDVQVDLPRTVP
jgi:hypothetical protein